MVEAARLATKGKKKSKEHNLKNKIWHLEHPNKKFKDTSIELKVKSLLDLLGIKYVFQYPLGKVAITDFFIPEKNLIIFCDGCYWHGCPIHHPTRNEHCERDKRQTRELQNLGYKVIRLWEHDIKELTTLQI